MIPCHSCSRHVAPLTRVCPFCRATLQDAVAPMPALAAMLLGSTMAACGGREVTETGEGAGTMAETTTAGTTTGTSGSTTDPTSEGSITTEGGPSAVYAGPSAEESSSS